MGNHFDGSIYHWLTKAWMVTGALLIGIVVAAIALAVILTVA